jgi:endonuclease/exonuclease/phosphatase family metal-dependent hydrolase
MTLTLASFNVENLFARAKALDTADRGVGEPVVAAFATFNTVAAEEEYTDDDKATLLSSLETLGILVRTPAGELRPNPDPFSAWALLRENRGDFLVAPRNGDPRIEAGGRGEWIGWVELLTEPVDEVAVRMTARVIDDVAANVLCLVEAEDRPSLVRFNRELLAGRYGRAMLIDGNDPRGIDVALLCDGDIDIVWMRSHVDLPDPASAAGRPLFSRDCPVYHLRLPGGDELFLLLNHLKSQSFSSGNPDPLRSRQSAAVRDIYDQLRAEGAQHIAVLGDLNKGPDRNDPTTHPTLEPLLGPGTPLVDAYDLPEFEVGSRPGSFQSCTLPNRLDYILLSPELAAKAGAGGVFRKGLWGNPKNIHPPAPDLWTIYPEIESGKNAASDHAAIWVELDV